MWLKINGPNFDPYRCSEKKAKSSFPPSAPGLIFSRFFDEILVVALKKRIMGLDPPYVAVFSDPSVAIFLKSVRENSSALESRVNPYP